MLEKNSAYVEVISRSLNFAIDFNEIFMEQILCENTKIEP